jgi:antitoxin HicB
MVKPPPRLFKIRLVLEPQPEGGWTITSPDIPELVTEADVPEDIEPNVRDALAALREHDAKRGLQLTAGLEEVGPGELTMETLVAAV